jgi:hypothetical protein
LGYINKVLKPEYIDPTVKNKIHSAKLVKWKLFVHCEKIIDF